MYNNDNSTHQNTLQAWATGKVAMFTIGLLAGYALYKMGVLQQLTNKIFKKKEGE